MMTESIESAGKFRKLSSRSTALLTVGVLICGMCVASTVYASPALEETEKNVTVIESRYADALCKIFPFFPWCEKV